MLFLKNKNDDPHDGQHDFFASVLVNEFIVPIFICQNPGLLSFGLILFRWHNIQAKRLQREYPEWTDEDLFQVNILKQ